MDIVSGALGFLGIVLGVRSLSKGATRLADAMGPAAAAGVRRRVENGVPTLYVPRSATLKEAPMISQGKRAGTVAGQMRRTMRSVGTLNDRLASILKGVDDAKTDPTIIAWARRVTSQKGPDGRWLAPEKATVKEIELIHNAIRNQVRYTSDPRSVDTFSNPKKTLEMRAGDCDEEAALACAALMSIGIKCRLKVVAEKGNGGQPSHIYALAASDKNGPVRKWIATDPTVAMPAGWEVSPAQISQAWIFETE